MTTTGSSFFRHSRQRHEETGADRMNAVLADGEWHESGTESKIAPIKQIAL